MMQLRIAAVAMLLCVCATAEADERLPWRLDVDATVDDFSNARGHEQAVDSQLGFRYSKDVLAYLRFGWANRFDAHDQVYVVGTTFQPTEALLFNIEAGGAPSADFSASSQAQVRMDVVASDFLQPSIAWRHLHYPSGDIETFTPGIRLLTPGGNIEFRDAFSDDIDGSLTSYRLLKFYWITGEQDQYSFYIAGSQGSEALPPERRAHFYSITGGASWIASRLWELRADLGYGHRRNTYSRHSVALGITRNF